MERLRQMFEREWGRREACITGKFRRILSNLLETGMTAHSTNSVFSYISCKEKCFINAYKCMHITVCISLGSEADVHDLNRSYRKVSWWMNHGTSGFCSDSHAEDLDTEIDMDVTKNSTQDTLRSRFETMW